MRHWRSSSGRKWLVFIATCLESTILFTRLTTTCCITMTIKYEFVEFIPDKLQTDTLYVSVSHRTAIHKCLCGCGVEVVTPISPTDWRITFDGETVSLFPSIGNWSYPCRSHYWIKKGKV